MAAQGSALEEQLALFLLEFKRSQLNKWQVRDLQNLGAQHGVSFHGCTDKAGIIGRILEYDGQRRIFEGADTYRDALRLALDLKLQFESALVQERQGTAQLQQQLQQAQQAAHHQSSRSQGAAGELADLGRQVAALKREKAELSANCTSLSADLARERDTTRGLTQQVQQLRRSGGGGGSFDKSGGSAAAGSSEPGSPKGGDDGSGGGSMAGRQAVLLAIDHRLHEKVGNGARDEGKAGGAAGGDGDGTGGGGSGGGGISTPKAGGSRTKGRSWSEVQIRETMVEIQKNAWDKEPAARLAYANEVLERLRRQVLDSMAALEREAADMMREELRNNLYKALDGFVTWVQDSLVDGAVGPDPGLRVERKRINAEVIPSALAVLDPR